MRAGRFMEKWGGGGRCQPCGRSDGPAASRAACKDALLQAERLYYRLLDVPEIHQLLELPLELGAVVGVHVRRHPRAWNTFFMPGARKTVLRGSAATLLVSASMATR